MLAVVPRSAQRRGMSAPVTDGVGSRDAVLDIRLMRYVRAATGCGWGSRKVALPACKS
jgi:hypothetical protein